MKQRHVLSLLQTGFTTVNVSFPASQHRQDVPSAKPQYPWQEAPGEKRPAGAADEKLYVYKTKDTDLKAGDRVIVERANTPSGLAIGIVHSVDLSPKIDVDAEFDYKWIVQRVDMESYGAIVRAESQFEAQLQEVEREHQREQLLQKMTAHLPADSKARQLFDAAVQGFGTAFGAQAAIGMQPAAAPAAQPQAAPAPAFDGQISGVACK